ncbi:MAG: hypothetical protein IIZ10_10795 [Solobacterium sp.]|nr:hypothetical protein [Solobacterium sp.]
MFRKLLSVMLALMLAGCASNEAAPADSASGNHGCDAFEACDDTEGTGSDTSLSFKESYEALNGTENSSGKVHRTISIPENHPFEKTEPEDVVEMIHSGESFWLYFGDPKCPWCRAVIETAIQAAEESGVTSIKYIEIWDGEGNEILRDKYELNGGTPVKTGEGTAEYEELLNLLDPVLEPYELEDESGNLIDAGEKRIYAPNYVRIENGKAVRLITGIPSELSDPRGELSTGQIAEEKAQFMEFFAEGYN